jgi:dihydroneopterin aldolase
MTTTTIFIRNLEVAVNIGVHKHEFGMAQPVRINVELTTDTNNAGDRLESVVDYEAVANSIRAIVAEGHISLAETLAERIATHCLKDKRVAQARVRVEKLRALAGAEAAGVEIVRNRA